MIGKDVSYKVRRSNDLCKLQLVVTHHQGHMCIPFPKHVVPKINFLLTIIILEKITENNFITIPVTPSPPKKSE